MAENTYQGWGNYTEWADNDFKPKDSVIATTATKMGTDMPFAGAFDNNALGNPYASFGTAAAAPSNLLGQEANLIAKDARLSIPGNIGPLAKFADSPVSAGVENLVAPAESGGLGAFANYTSPDGVVTGLNEEAYNAVNGTLTPGTLDKVKPIGSAGGSGLDWGMSGIGGSLVGAGQLGLGIMSYLDTKKSNEVNRNLTNQQIANNAVLAKNKADDRVNLHSAFNA